MCAQALGTGLNWLGNLLVGLTFPMMLPVMGVGGSYLVYVAFNVAAVIFLCAWMVETKQRSLAQITDSLLVR